MLTHNHIIDPIIIIITIIAAFIVSPFTFIIRIFTPHHHISSIRVRMTPEFSLSHSFHKHFVTSHSTTSAQKRTGNEILLIDMMNRNQKFPLYVNQMESMQTPLLIWAILSFSVSFFLSLSLSVSFSSLSHFADFHQFKAN